MHFILKGHYGKAIIRSLNALDSFRTWFNKNMAGLQHYEEKQTICGDLSLPVKPLFWSTFEHLSPGFSFVCY